MAVRMNEGKRRVVVEGRNGRIQIGKWRKTEGKRERNERKGSVIRVKGSL